MIFDLFFLLFLLLFSVGAQSIPRINYTPNKITLNDTFTMQTFFVNLEEPIICPDQNRPCQMILNYTSLDPRINTPEILVWDADLDFNAWQETKNFTITYDSDAGCQLNPAWDSQAPWQNRTGINILIDQVHPNVTSELYNGFDPDITINLPIPKNCSGIDIANSVEISDSSEQDNKLSTMSIFIIIILSFIGILFFVSLSIEIQLRRTLFISTKCMEESRLIFPALHIDMDEI